MIIGIVISLVVAIIIIIIVIVAVIFVYRKKKQECLNFIHSWKNSKVAYLADVGGNYHPTTVSILQLNNLLVILFYHNRQ